MSYLHQLYFIKNNRAAFWPHGVFIRHAIKQNMLNIHRAHECLKYFMFYRVPDEDLMGLMLQDYFWWSIICEKRTFFATVATSNGAWCSLITLICYYSYRVNNNSLKLIYMYQVKSEVQFLNNIKSRIQFLFMYNCDWILQKGYWSHKYFFAVQCNKSSTGPSNLAQS